MIDIIDSIYKPFPCGACIATEARRFASFSERGRDTCPTSFTSNPGATGRPGRGKREGKEREKGEGRNGEGERGKGNGEGIEKGKEG